MTMMLPKRSRKSAPKTKTGCKTCRIRRVKCDDTIPVCQRCHSTGRKCDGYDIIIPKPTIKSAIIQLWGEVEERRLFHTFQTTTAAHFSWSFATNFWSVVLQACHVNSSIRYAAISLALLHERFIMSKLPAEHQIENLILKYYGQALQKTRSALSARDQPIIITIMSCVLLSCFESFRGELANAMVHLRSGLDIFSSHATSLDSALMLSVSQIFTKIGFQANYFVDNSDHGQLIGQLRSMPIIQLSLAPTLEQLQHSLYSCLNGSMFSGRKEDQKVDLQSLGTNYSMTKCAQLILSGSNSPDFLRGREMAIRNLEKWRSTFDNYVQTHDRRQLDMETRALALLELHHLVATMMLNLEHDPFMRQGYSDLTKENMKFKQIIDLSASLLAGKSAIPALFPDVGVIAPLFFVATKSCNTSLQEQARQILDSGHRREGIWDSKIAVQIIVKHHSIQVEND